MRKRINTAMALLLALLMSVGTLAGCSRSISAEDYATTVVATFGDEKIYLDEANFLAKKEQYLMETYYSYLAGTTDFWDYDLGDGSTIEDATKESVMSSIFQTRLLCSMASEYGIALSAEDEQKVKDAIAEFKESVPESVLAEMGGTNEELLTDIYTQNALANRVWEYLVKDIDTNVDYEENRQITVHYLTFDRTEAEDAAEEESASAADSESSAEDADAQSGEEIPYEDTEEYAEMEKLAQDVIEDLKAGVTMSDEVDKLKEDATITARSSTETFGREDHENAYGEVSWSLKTGEYGYAYVEEDGWYVIYCDTDNDEDATNKEIENILDERRTEMFHDKYAELLESAPKFKVDEDVWANVTFSKALYEIPETTEAESTEGESTEAQSTEAESSAAESESETSSK